MCQNRQFDYTSGALTERQSKNQMPETDHSIELDFIVPSFAIYSSLLTSALEYKTLLASVVKNLVISNHNVAFEIVLCTNILQNTFERTLLDKFTSSIPTTHQFFNIPPCNTQHVHKLIASFIPSHVCQHLFPLGTGRAIDELSDIDDATMLRC